MIYGQVYNQLIMYNEYLNIYINIFNLEYHNDVLTPAIFSTDSLILIRISYSFSLIFI